VIPELEEIKRILLQEWDPIGASGVDEAADEYDAYALQIFTSLHQGVTVVSLSEYLDRIETEHMGLAARSERSNEVARKVLALHEGRIGS
jgi:hypothetical protein